jgi:hypothetical protein
MGRRPEVVTRLLGSPGNWTIATISDLLLAIAGEELDATSSNPLDKPPRNIAARDLTEKGSGGGLRNEGLVRFVNLNA